MNELNNLKKVPAPDFLFAKIQAEIIRRKENATPPQMILASMLLVVMLAITGIVVRNSLVQARDSGTAEMLSTPLNLNPTNQLYNE